MGMMINAETLKEKSEAYTSRRDVIKSIMNKLYTADTAPKKNKHEQPKTDIVAILMEIQSEIEEIAKCPYEQCVGGECPFQDCMIHKGRVIGLLQERIDKLKAESED